MMKIFPIRNETDYEARHHTIDFPDPVEAIKFRMEQEGMKQKDLVEILGGSKSQVSEPLNRKRGLTLEMIRKLHERLKIPFENLVGEDTIAITLPPHFHFDNQRSFRFIWLE